MEADPDPITEKTKAIQAIQSTLEDLTADVREIRRMLKAGESRWSALWRAVCQFVGDLKNGSKP